MRTYSEEDALSSLLEPQAAKLVSVPSTVAEKVYYYLLRGIIFGDQGVYSFFHVLFFLFKESFPS